MSRWSIVGLIVAGMCLGAALGVPFGYGVIGAVLGGGIFGLYLADEGKLS